MSSGDGGVGVGGFLAFCFFCYVMSFLGVPIGLAMFGDFLLWGWYAFLAIVGLSVSLTALGVALKFAIQSRDWHWLFDIVVAPVVTVWPAYIYREAERDAWLWLFDKLTILACAFLFFYLLGGWALAMVGMFVGAEEVVVDEFEWRAPAGPLIRLFTGYLQFYLFYATWFAIILNSVDPKK